MGSLIKNSGFCWPRSELRLDLYLTACVFFITAILAYSFLLITNPKSYFYQEQFSPAIMLACGKGFSAAARTPQSNPIFDFLAAKKPALNCSEIPGDILVSPLNRFQQVHKYLMGFTSTVWHLFGISWKSLQFLYVILYGLSCAMIYLLFRLGTNRPFALAGTALIAVSYLHFSYITHLRDYAKAPFMLAMLLCCVLLVCADSRKQRLAVAVIAGLVFGIGIGVRMDIMLFIPFIYLTILLFTSIDWKMGGVYEKLTLVVVFSGVALLSGWPILASLSGGGNTFHVILLGLAPIFFRELGLAGGQELLSFYNDSYLVHTLSAWALPEFGANRLLLLATTEYERVGLKYWLVLMSYFPADFFIGGLAAIRSILELLYQRYNVVLGISDIASFLREIPSAIRYLFIGLPFLACAVLPQSGGRLFFFLAFLVSYISGVTFLQFSPRHYFYLEFISLWFVLCSTGLIFVYGYKFARRLSEWIADSVYWDCGRFSIAVGLRESIAGGRFGSEILRTAAHRLMNIPALRRVLTFAAIIVLAPIFLLALLENIQQARTITLQQEFIGLPLVQAPVSRVVRVPPLDPKPGGTAPVKTERLVLDWKARFATSTGAMQAIYLAFDFDPKVCSRNDLAFRVSYVSDTPYHNFSRNIAFRAEAPTRYFLPTYKGNGYHFDSLDIDSALASCLTAVRMVDPSARAPLMIDFAAPIDPDRFQTIGRRTFR